MKLLQSILSDLKSWDKIIYNRWHLHVSIAAAVGVGLGYLFSFVDFAPVWYEQLFEVVIPCILMFMGCFGFEGLQQIGRTIEPEERFESNKDGWVGTIIGVIAITITKIILG